MHFCDHPLLHTMCNCWHCSECGCLFVRCCATADTVVSVAVFLYDAVPLLTLWWVWSSFCTMLCHCWHCSECSCLLYYVVALLTLVSGVVFLDDVMRLLTLRWVWLNHKDSVGNKYPFPLRRKHTHLRESSLFVLKGSRPKRCLFWHFFWQMHSCGAAVHLTCHTRSMVQFRHRH